ncbi:MAG: hypothetical protein ACOC3F_01570 [Desulfosudaceae bacterium]
MPDPDRQAAAAAAEAEHDFTGSRPDRESAIDSQAADIIIKVMGLPASQRLIRTILEKMLTAWAGTSPVRRLPAAVLKKTVPRLAPPAPENVPAEIGADLGRLLQKHWQRRAAETRRVPEAAAETLSAFLTAFLENTDFSAWKTAVEAGQESRIRLFQQLNELLPEYHGKMLVFLTALPSLVSTGCAVLRDFFETQLEVLPPDMIYEINEGIIGRVNWGEVGQVLNDYHALAARLHTGSRIAGDGDTTALQRQLTDILSGITETLDMEKLAAADEAAAGSEAAVANAVTAVMASRPEFGRAIRRRRLRQLNTRLRITGRRLRSLSRTDDASLEELLADIENMVDIQELADTVSDGLELLLRLQEIRPDFWSDLLTMLTGALDPEDVTESGRPLLHDFFRTARPLLAPLLPDLIHGFCDLATPESGQADPEMAAALDRLGRILGGEKN